MESRHLLMKAPVHMFNLDTLYKTFPDGCFVLTLRPMRNVVASFLSLMKMVTINYRIKFDQRWVDRHIQIFRVMTEKAVRYKI